MLLDIPIIHLPGLLASLWFSVNAPMQRPPAALQCRGYCGAWAEVALWLSETSGRLPENGWRLILIDPTALRTQNK